MEDISKQLINVDDLGFHLYNSETEILTVHATAMALLIIHLKQVGVVDEQFIINHRNYLSKMAEKMKDNSCSERYVENLIRELSPKK